MKPLTDQQQAKEVEAILAGKIPKRECVVCKKSQTTKRCKICTGVPAVCNDCKGGHRDRHFDVHEIPCELCKKPTKSRCQRCGRAICYLFDREKKKYVDECIRMHRASSDVCKKATIRVKRLNRPRFDILETAA